MYTIGITGGTGSGKTIALHALEELGALALDCDAIYHDLLETNVEMKMEIARCFKTVLHDDKIDRKMLGEIVFADKSALQTLNDITHKYVINEVNHQLAMWEKQGGSVGAIDAIALFESGANAICDKTVGIIAPVEKRVSRITKRDGITKKQAELRINAQKPDSFYINNCDTILENNFDTSEEFEEHCKVKFTKMLSHPAMGRVPAS